MFVNHGHPPRSLGPRQCGAARLDARSLPRIPRLFLYVRTQPCSLVFVCPVCHVHHPIHPYKQRAAVQERSHTRTYARARECDLTFDPNCEARSPCLHNISALHLSTLHCAGSVFRCVKAGEYGRECSCRVGVAREAVSREGSESVWKTALWYGVAMILLTKHDLETLVFDLQCTYMDVMVYSQSHVLSLDRFFLCT